MNELLDVEIILSRKKYSNIYNMGIIILGVMGIFIILACILDYNDYLVIDAQVKGNELELLISSDEISDIINNKYLIIDKNKYYYVVKRISEEIITLDDGKNYQYLYIDINNIDKINNYIYQIRILKERKKLIKFLIN